MLPDGYFIFENIITPAECGDLISRLGDLPRDRGRAGVRNLMGHHWTRSLASDSRLIDLTEIIYGRRLTPYKATLFNKTAKANWLVAWHQDTTLPIEEFVPDSGWSARSMKAGRLFAQAPSSALEKILALRLHLDASTDSNGLLRVIPRSHTRGVLSDQDIASLVCENEAVECIVGRGGVIAMSPLLLHASSKITSDEPRRVLHIEYAESLEITDGIKLAFS